MDTITQGLALLAVIAATIFSLAGVVGFYRLPDVYTRLHATGKVASFGVVLLLIAAILWTPLKFGKGMVLIIVMLLAAPVVAHAISSASYRLGIPFREYIRNDLVEAEPILEERFNIED